ncbi:hypothetical protein HG536_0B00540 [Torulaspora globosa]|uniref:Gfd2/YDR514C-like C-terminal domain-containing protein n=1 Tax=Torulaspora globosa TaxID=48254 RepID=A0A7G3ZCF7_9SACH|nr:uncharacterized protein HG536_0B00540 [Torulaspora globosa]QLL31193.1 hypothetical protein HG536_0B00540 [Torulaspora globosa]
MKRATLVRMFTEGGMKIPNSEAGFSTVPVRTQSGAISSRVRGLPYRMKTGIGMYKSACSSVPNKGGKKKTWVDEFDHFGQLRKLRWPGLADSHSCFRDVVEKYLADVEVLYRELNAVSARSLNEKLDAVKERWVAEHGSLPEVSTGKERKREKVRKQERVKARDGKQLGVASEVQLTVEANKQLLEQEDEKKMRKQYDQALRQVKENHCPTVYANPGTSNFDYLTNSIRLMSTKKTICFSLDVEAYEFDNDVVTEIGIAVYDPRENINPLVPLTRNYHLIISEALHLRNRKWVCDFKDCFLLGESFVLSLHECVEFVQALVDYYMTPQTAEDRSWSRAFVGHNLQGDLRWLRKMGVKVPADGDLDYTLQKADLKADVEKEEPIFVLDTEKLYRLCYGSKGSNLGRLLRLFRIPHAFLHNAGNDAHYTLKLLMHMCDVNFRKQYGMDNLEDMSRKINQWIDREKEEPKVLPMSYAVSVVDATRKRHAVSKNDNTARRKQAKDLVPQTEFGGSRYFDSAREAFSSTLCK